MTPLLLFLLTFLTTLVAGAFLSGGDPLARPSDLIPGLMFNLPLLAILGIHEMGHYTAARRHQVVTTPPYFIPFLPIPPLPGTMGAVIKLKSPFPDRNALMDIGSAGPLAGAIVAIPVLMAGLALSEIRRTTGGLGSELGESLLFKLLSRIVLGEIPAGHDVFLHPMGYAGWLGLYITMLNLIPAGQLDGGHIAYAVLGRRAKWVSLATLIATLLLTLRSTSWIAMAVIMLAMAFFLGLRHPHVTYGEEPLDPTRKKIALFAAVMFILCFTPVPIEMFFGQ